MRLVPIGIVLRRQQVRGGRIVHDLADLVADELRRGVVGALLEDQVVERRHEAGAALRPAFLENAPPFVGRHFQSRLVVQTVQDARALHARLQPQRRIVGLPALCIVRLHRAVARRDAVVRRALEHGQLRRLFGDHRDRLDGRGSGADHADAQPGEIDAFMRPMSGVVGLAAETVPAGEIRQPRIGQAAGRHDAEPRLHPVAAVGADVPEIRRLIEARLGDAGLEMHVAAQVQPVGDVVGIAQDFWLGGKQFAPVPFLLQLRIECVGILHALDVAAGARIAVPVPGAADAGGGFEHHGGQAEPAQAVQHVHAGEPGTDDDGVESASQGGARSGFGHWTVLRRERITHR